MAKKKTATLVARTICEQIRTISANLERGIEIKVPHDTSDVFLSF